MNTQLTAHTGTVIRLPGGVSQPRVHAGPTWADALRIALVTVVIAALLTASAILIGATAGQPSPFRGGAHGRASLLSPNPRASGLAWLHPESGEFRHMHLA